MDQNVPLIFEVWITFKNESFSIWSAFYHSVYNNLLSKDRSLSQQFVDFLISTLQFCADLHNFNIFHSLIVNANLHGEEDLPQNT
jgi:hypothetical protein